jgi:transposase
MMMSRGFGVIDVALLGIIRRWHIRDQVRLREIARRLDISRNTVRRYLRAEITEPSYPERQSPSAIDKYAFQLSAMLKTEAAKSRKQRLTLKQLHLKLKELGFDLVGLEAFNRLYYSHWDLAKL